MTLEEFTIKLEKELEEVEAGTLHPDSVYRDLKNWSSMYALIIIAFIDFNFNIILNSKELKETSTIRELYNLVKSKSV